MIAIILVLAVLLFSLPVYAGQGWYLMIPPAAGKGAVDFEAPLRRWPQAAAFDTAKACEDSLRDLYTTAKANFQSVGSDENKRGIDSLTFARCIASDDPRLK